MNKPKKYKCKNCNYESDFTGRCSCGSFEWKQNIPIATYYDPEIPKQTKSRFGNMTFYKKMMYKEQTYHRSKITEFLQEMIDCSSKDEWINSALWLMQEVYIMINANFMPEEIAEANKLFLENMINKYEKSDKNE